MTTSNNSLKYYIVSYVVFILAFAICAFTVNILEYINQIGKFVMAFCGVTLLMGITEIKKNGKDIPESHKIAFLILATMLITAGAIFGSMNFETFA